MLSGTVNVIIRTAKLIHSLLHFHSLVVYNRTLANYSNSHFQVKCFVVVVVLNKLPGGKSEKKSLKHSKVTEK